VNHNSHVLKVCRVFQRWWNLLDMGHSGRKLGNGGKALGGDTGILTTSSITLFASWPS
jgi:hypothetical protein